MYYDINVDLAKRPDFMARNPDFAQFLKASEVDLHGAGAMAARGGPTSWCAWRRDVRESLRGRTGGAVTLAVGMAASSRTPMPGRRWLIAYWYHFAIMFEALFILTTIDTGTRIARFLVQESSASEAARATDWLPAADAGHRRSSSAGAT